MTDCICNWRKLGGGVEVSAGDPRCPVHGKYPNVTYTEVMNFNPQQLYTCNSCGALVPDGMCLVDHILFHRSLTT